MSSNPATPTKGICLLGMLLLSCSLGFSQAAGEIAGKVADPTGAVIPGVEVTALNTQTGASRTALSSESGIYRIPLLPPGRYSVRASLTGFKTGVREGVTLTVGEVNHIDIRLEVGSISETVTVSGEAPVVNTEQGRVSTLVDAKRIADLPLNGRNIYQLMQIAPGTVNVTNTITEPGTGQGGLSTTSVNGGRVNFNGFWLDGVGNKGLSGGTNLDPSVDSIQEFRMETLNFSAEFGNSSGSVINVVSKAGTNRFHGTAYEFHRNDNLDAREFFDEDGKPEFKQNQFGATLGGPIRKNSTFFFASYEGLRIRTGQSAIETFESPQWASFVKSYGAPVAKFLYANYPGKAITTVTDTVGSYLVSQGLVPAGPNDGPPTQANVDGFLRSEFNSPAGALKVGDPIIGETSFFTPDTTDANQFSVRIDQEMRGGKDKLFGRYYRNQSESPIVVSRAAFNSPSIAKGHQLALTETHIFSPRIVNEFRAGLNRGVLDIIAGTPGVPQIVDGANGVTYFGAYNGYPQSFHENTFTYSDVISISKGNHGMKMGVTYQRNQENSEFNVGRPSYTFYGLVYLALDDPYYQVGGVDPHIVDGTRRAELHSNFRGWRNREVGLFFNDDWKIRPNLTLNLGLRFDLYTRLREVQGRTTKFDLSKGDDIFARVRNGNFAVADALSAGDHNNFAPRVGFAWDPSGNGKMSVRGGFGVAYQSGVYNPLANSRWNPPFYSFNLICRFDACQRPNETVLYGPQRAGQAVTVTGADPNPGAGSFEGNIIAYEPTNNNSTYLTGIANPNMRDPYVMSWFVGIQREIFRNTSFEINYVGTGGRKIIRAENFNRFNGDRIGRASPTGEFAGATALNRVNPAFGILRFWENSVSSSYNGLQTQVSRRFSKGWAMTGNYTWAHSLDTRSTWHSGATTTSLAQEGYSTDVTNQRLDYGRSIFDARHRLVVSYIWELPFFKDRNGLVNAILGGWQVNGGLSLQSGLPFTPYDARAFSNVTGGDYNADGNNNDRPNAPSIGNSFDAPERSMWVNPGGGPFRIPTTNPEGVPTTSEKLGPYFGRPANGTNGTLGRNTYEGPGYANHDFATFKNFRLPFGEEAKLQVRFEFFNVFNRVNFQQPEPRINNSRFGRPFSTFDARQIQIGLKVIF
jgi:hypothetical protein